MNLSGANCLVTGANTGLGFAVAKMMADRGANTILLCRNKEKGRGAVNDILEENRDASLDLMICDLASMESIHRFINEFTSKYSRLDVLCNNAAVMNRKRMVTDDGFEMMFQVNYLAPFMFMNSLVELMKNAQSPYIINIARPGYKDVLDMDDLQFEKKYGLWTSFFVTKLYLFFASLEFSRRADNEGISISMIDPAGRPFKSELVRDFPLMGWIKNMFSAPVNEAAETIIHHITSGDVSVRNGKVFKGTREWPLSDYWKDTSISERLWSVTESLIKDN